MIRLVCDKCRKDCDRTAYDILIRSVHNPVPVRFDDTECLSITDEPFNTIRFMVCQKCYREMKLPNVYECNSIGGIVWREGQDDSKKDKE